MVFKRRYEGHGRRRIGKRLDSEISKCWRKNCFRKESPGVYESYLDLEPGASTKFKLVVRGARPQHCQDKWRNNRAENSHPLTRLRERLMRRFKSAGHVQRFLSAFGIITSHFRVGRHLYRATGYREVMKLRFAIWEAVIRVESAA